MFYHINGVVTDIEPNLVVLECGGVGYALNASLNTISSVRTGERAKLYTYECIREDAHDLYGFASKSEKHCFELLLGISGAVDPFVQHAGRAGAGGAQRR
jgi:Holliday junction DNA helicase RuvA